jgi:hypothetical protein
MALTALQPQPEPKATPRSAEWCEIGRQSDWHSVVRLHEQSRVPVTLARQITFRNKIPTVGVLRRPVLIATFGNEAVRKKKA